MLRSRPACWYDPVTAASQPSRRDRGRKGPTTPPLTATPHARLDFCRARSTRSSTPLTIAPFISRIASFTYDMFSNSTNTKPGDFWRHPHFLVLSVLAELALQDVVGHGAVEACHEGASQQ
ncbi:hypothetical protein MRX96_014435 [Rhipicephalus microplus]